MKATMTSAEFTCGTLRERQYVLEHREDKEALSIYVERFRDPNARSIPTFQYGVNLKSLH